MLQPINSLQFTQSGFNHIISDMAARQQAVKMFDKAFSTAQRKRLFSRLMRGSRRMQHLTEKTIPVNSRHISTQVVSIDAIRGTESRGDEFDVEFLPLAEHVEQRWVSVAAAMMSDVTLPPVELLKIGNSYYVRDGHHRISVARAMGTRSVDAVVTEFTD
jgi:hypothetical protein